MEQLLKGMTQEVPSPYIPSRSAHAAQKLTSRSEEGIREVVQRICAGENQLFEVIVEQYQGEVFSVAWKMTHNSDDASDIAQDTFIRVYRALSSWTGRAKFSTWLYRIALNTSLDYLRRQSKHYKKRFYVNDSDDENPRLRQELEGIDYTNPCDAVQARRRKEQILTLLLHISPMQRKCFLLHFFQEKSLKEISEILRCGTGSVKRHIHRAKMRLRELLKETES